VRPTLKASRVKEEDARATNGGEAGKEGLKENEMMTR
jgi:hypothetical protein